MSRSKPCGWAASRLLILLFAGLTNAGCAFGAVPQLAFRSDLLGASWKQGDAMLRLVNPATGQSLGVAIGPSSLEFDSGVVTGFNGRAVRASLQNVPNGAIWRFVWPAKPVPGSRAAVHCKASIELNRSVGWIRKRATVEVRDGQGSTLLKEVVIDSLDVTGLGARQPFDGWQSYPVLCDAFFTGVESPAAEARVKDNTARLACKPGFRLAKGQKYEVKPAVYGVTPPGRSRQAFEEYISTLRPRSPLMHIQYNSWWSAPYPFTEQQMLDIIRVFYEQYHKPFGGRLDSFCLDMGWAKSQSMWQIDTANFPQGFKPLTSGLARMNAALGLWVSPSSFYPFAGGLDNEWAGRQGYETFPVERRHLNHLVCLAGPRFSSDYRDALAGHTRRDRIAHFKFDGYAETCPETGHGHEPGELSAEPMTEGFLAACRAIRKENPDVWLEATCFGFRPSPWWLADINSVIGTFGSDAPHGRVPCPVYRESATTARDFYNLQGARDILAPIYAQEVLGIIHQTPDALQNDAVTVVLRGHCFIPMYINPKYMNPRRWRFLANLTTWARDNASLLAHTRALSLGGWGDDAKSRKWESSLPRDSYGYAHFHEERGLLLLRNPWIRPQRVTLKLDESLGTGSRLKNARPVCLYPLFGSMAGRYSFGDSIAIDLRPYETRLVAFGGYEDAPMLPPSARRISAGGVQNKVEAAGGKVDLRFDVDGEEAGRQPSWGSRFSAILSRAIIFKRLMIAAWNR